MDALSYGLVCFNAEPSAVPEGLIPALQRRVEQINATGGELFESLRHGETVRIEAGPFEGYEAIFDARLPGSERVRVLLKLMSRQQVPLVLPAGQVQPVKPQTPVVSMAAQRWRVILFVGFIYCPLAAGGRITRYARRRFWTSGYD